MTKLADRDDIPTLSGGWVNFTEAAEQLGWSRSYMYKYAESPGFKTLHRIGGKASYVVNQKEIESIKDSRVLPVVEEAVPKKQTKVAVSVVADESAPKELSLEEVLEKL